MQSGDDSSPGPCRTNGGHHARLVNFAGSGTIRSSYGVASSLGIDGRLRRGLEVAKEHRPKLIVCGGSAYPRTVDTAEFRKIADEVDALLMCDMAHFSGLVAAGLHPNPVERCDIVTSTTHKTLAGPRAGFVLCREEHAQAVDRAVFPGMQGGPLMHVIAAKAACFQDRRLEAFRSCQGQVRANADALSDELMTNGLDVAHRRHRHRISSSSTCARRTGPGKDAEERLHEVKLTVNRNTVPFDERPADRRLGCPDRHHRRRRCAASTQEDFQGGGPDHRRRSR